MASSRSIRVLAAVLALSMASCSFFIKGVKKDREPNEDPECQDYIVAPIADGAVGGLFALYGASQCGRSGTACLSSLAVGGVFLGAAVWGTLKILKCRKANREFRQANEPTASVIP